MTLSAGWRYFIFWIRFLAVAVLTAWAYCEVAEILPAAVNELPGIGGAYKEIKGTWLAWPAKVIVGILVCWRMVKALVLHGWPFPLWLQTEPGKDPKSGRVVTGVRIGDADEFWFGTVLRSHPASDKIVRSRLELLVIRFASRGSLCVREGRLYLHKYGTEGAAAEYDSVMRPYRNEVRGH